MRDRQHCRSGLIRPRGRQRQEATPVFLQQSRGLVPSRAVHSLIGGFTKPDKDLGIRRGHIQSESGLSQPGRQRHDKAAPEVADESLDLPFGFGSVGPTQPRSEAMVSGEISETGVETVAPWTVSVSFDYNGLHVVVEDAPWHAVEEGE